MKTKNCKNYLCNKAAIRSYYNGFTSECWCSDCLNKIEDILREKTDLRLEEHFYYRLRDNKQLRIELETYALSFYLAKDSIEEAKANWPKAELDDLYKEKDIMFEKINQIIYGNLLSDE